MRSFRKVPWRLRAIEERDIADQRGAAQILGQAGAISKGDRPASLWDRRFDAELKAAS
jgi:hypothetical protein